MKTYKVWKDDEVYAVFFKREPAKEMLDLLIDCDEEQVHTWALTAYDDDEGKA